MARKAGPNLKSLEKSRKLILESATQEFLDYGYANASTSRIVKRCGLAQGSLYYHFTDKQSVFCEIYQNINLKILQEMKQNFHSNSDSWDIFLTNCQYFIEQAANNQIFRKIVLIEGQNAIPYDDRINLLRKTILGALLEAIKGLMDQGILPKQNVLATGLMVYGMLAELGRGFELAQNGPEFLAEAQKTLARTLNALK